MVSDEDIRRNGLLNGLLLHVAKERQWREGDGDRKHEAGSIANLGGSVGETADNPAGIKI